MSFRWFQVEILAVKAAAAPPEIEPELVEASDALVQILFKRLIPNLNQAHLMILAPNWRLTNNN